jgi:hypothetical protein
MKVHKNKVKKKVHKKKLKRKFTRSYVLVWQLWDINKSVMHMYETSGENRGRGARQTHGLIPVLVVSNFIKDL